MVFGNNLLLGLASWGCQTGELWDRGRQEPLFLNGRQVKTGSPRRVSGQGTGSCLRAQGASSRCGSRWGASRLRSGAPAPGSPIPSSPFTHSPSIPFPFPTHWKLPENVSGTFWEGLRPKCLFCWPYKRSEAKPGCCALTTDGTVLNPSFVTSLLSGLPSPSVSISRLICKWSRIAHWVAARMKSDSRRDSLAQ